MRGIVAQETWGVKAQERRESVLRANARHFIIQSMRIQDVRGRVFETTVAPQRIVSLVPSVTETLFEFGAGNRVVGITDYCIEPRGSGETKTKIGGTKNPRVDQILALEPDLVIANVEENRKPDIAALEAHGVSVFAMFPRTVRGAIDELRNLARLICAKNADAVIGPIHAAFIRQQSRQLKRRPRVFCAIWRDPWMTVNRETFISDLIETCGGKNIFRDRVRLYPLAADLGRAPAREVGNGHDTRYPRVSLEEVALLKPEVILLPDEPYRFDERDADELRAVPGLGDASIHLVDGTLVTWHGVRMARAIDRLTKIFSQDRIENGD